MISGGTCCPTADGGRDGNGEARHWLIGSGVAASLLLIVLAMLLDGAVGGWLDVRFNPSPYAFARCMSKLGEGWVLAVAGVVISGVLFLLGKFKGARIVFLVVMVSLLTGATATVLRSVVGRTRPNVHAAQGFYGVRYNSHWILGKTEFASFPSGHAATVIGLVAALWLFSRRSALVVGGYAALVCWARVAQGAHHFSDIVAAGVVAAWCAPWLTRRLQPGIVLASLRLQRACLRTRRSSNIMGEVIPRKDSGADLMIMSTDDNGLPESAPPFLTVAIPCHNEEGNLRALVGAIGEAAQSRRWRYEIVITDDCSTDNSWAILKELTANDRRIRAQRLQRNCGQSAALWAGLKAARGQVIVTMDADMQNSPGDLPKLVEALKGADCVCGSRVQARAQGDSFLRCASSRGANWIRNRLTQETVTDSGCCYRAFKRECLSNLKFFKGMHRFLPTLFKMEGYSVTEIPVSHNPRKVGKSHYGLWNRLFIATADLLAVRWMKNRILQYEIAEVINLLEMPNTPDAAER